MKFSTCGGSSVHKVLAFVKTGTQLSIGGQEVVVDSGLPPYLGLE